MFRWDFLRSAEVFFSRWAIKRVCKFLLKKKLGDFILGDIDVDQLEVQLSRGTLYLSDLAVNVEYLNQKLAGAAVMVKEGSVASLSIKIPWKLQNCQIELQDLELVLAPFVGKVQEANNCLVSNCTNKQQINLGPDKIDTGTGQDSCGSVSLDIHEGVKTIAKIVKWFLTSFHIKLKNLIVAFDPCLDGSENRFPFKKSLVLRIAETEFGTCLSEDVDKAPILKSDCLLGIAKLTNFVKFDGAVVEILKMNDIDKSSHPQDSYEAIYGDSSASSSLFGSSSVILAGRNAGFAGRVNLSIPWKNGSLDIHKVDADISFDPIELRLQPNIIEWIIILWESFKSAGSAARSCVRSSKIDSSCYNSRLQNYSSSQNSAILGADTTKPSRMRFSEELHPGMNDETFPDDRLPRTYVIQDWVPLLKEDQTEPVQDYGQSIDQFFECFDELRSSQANSGSSGLWNWTCSVFSAINVASNLASGSGHMLAEQQHVETCLRTTVAGVSCFLYFHDKEENLSDHLLGSDRVTNEPCQPNHGSPPTSHVWNPLLNEQSCDSYVSCFSSVDAARSTISEPNLTGMKMHNLEVKCEDVVINFQIGSRKTDCQISVKDVKINEYYDLNCHAMMLGLSDNSSHSDQMIINKTLKQKVLASLSPFPVLVKEYNPEAPMEHKTEKISENIYSQECLVKVGLLETFGDCSLSCVVSPADSDGSSVSISFNVHLPPCILWFHFHLAYSLLNFFKEVEKYFDKSSETRDLVYDDSSGGKKMFSYHDLKSGTSSITTVPSSGNVHGNIVFAQTRIIICFPLQTLEDFRHLYPMEKFIIFEHCPLPISEEVSEISPLPSRQLRAPNCNSCTPTFSVHLEIGTFDIYMIDSISKDAIIDQSVPLHVKDDFAVKVLTVTNRIGDRNSGINVIWQKGPVTGPWMAGRAWSLASTHNNRSRNKVTKKDCEFSSVTAVQDFEEISFDIRKELVLSSTLLLDLCFSIIRVNLSCHEYRSLNYLLDIVTRGLSNGAPSRVSVFEEEQPHINHDASQVTIIMDCDLLDICITLDKISDCSHSIQKELVSSWNCFKLVVEKFEIMSVSNIGGIKATNLFWLNHGEGKLWGSIFNGDDTTSATIQDVLLVSCNNSASRRGGGDGANVLSFGSAGTTITYLCNPQLFRSYTSILVRCGTLVMPGGCLDWISHLCSFFSFPSENESSGCGGNPAETSLDCTNYEASFFLDLVDVALSYEPYLKHPSINCEAYDECDDSFELNKGISEQFVGCLLAAASFSLSNHAISGKGTSDYDIQIQDLGLLICESSGSKNDYSSYDASYLQKTGYAKVATGSLLVAVLKLHDSQWEVECSDPHVNFDTCHDTTHGLFRLIAQLQQLYAPDMEDTLAYLQSRWNNVQQSHNTNGSNDDASDNTDHSSLSLSIEKKLTTSDGNSLSNGLLDGIIENAFNTTQDSSSSLSPSLAMRDNSKTINPNSSTSLDDIPSINMSFEGSVCNLVVENFCSTSKSGLNKTKKTCGKEECLSQLIDSYYFSEIIKPSLSAKVSPTTEEDKHVKFDILARADVECGKGGWYKDGYLMIVENHIPNSLLPDSHQHDKENKIVSADSCAADHCNPKGRIVIKNLDVRWRMFAGSDWSKLLKRSTGRDGSLYLELILSGLNIQYMIYPDSEVNLSKLSIHAQDFHLYDRSANAPWKMVIGHYNSRDHPRESYAKAFKLDLETVRPDPGTPLEDYRLYLECLPIRLHLDQSQINFLISFFCNGSSVDESPSLSNDTSMSCIPERESTIYGSKAVIEEALLPFFQKCEVKPLLIRVDYIPRHLDLSALGSGNYVELLNLVTWKGIDLQLKHVCAVGVYGWGSLCEAVLGQWLEDISHNQVHKLLRGLAPVRSLVSVASGTSKLVTLPVKSYKRDKKLLKGMQRGAIAFVKSISLEAVGLGVHLAAGAHEILHQAEYILTNVPSDASSTSEKGRSRKPAKTNQPEDAQEGIRQAYESLSDGLSRTASAILGTAIKEYRRGAGAGSALATAVRATPAAAIAPVTASAQAMHCALLGMRNSLDPEHKKESLYKYFGPSRS